ncbi:uncharacterized protein LOC126771699 [Nymphalis io]|uniref:uncharacterized protein LOC126771699 n=1 Tax=Inachis io TaxID=171585 RepID=UPI00216986E5|nr:uncharacterized protein LOC126771699 [Nymphalis io]
MQCVFILMTMNLILRETCINAIVEVKESFVSMEIDSVKSFGNDRIDTPYRFKKELRNHNEDTMFSGNRRLSAYPLVEVGPGSFKAEYPKLPPDYLINQFKKLLAIKKKMKENHD